MSDTTSSGGNLTFWLSVSELIFSLHRVQIARAAQWEDNLEAAKEVVLRIPELAEYIDVPDDTRLLETFEEAEFTLSGNHSLTLTCQPTWRL